jgi:general secretion pathway protein I
MTPPNIERRLMANRGFTLIEVLIALAVLAIALAAVIKTAGQSTFVSGELRDRTFANWVAMNELTSVRLNGEWPTSDSFNGDADMAGQKWHWVVDVSKTDDPDLIRLDVKVSNAQKPDDVVSTVTGFMGRPRVPLNGLNGPPPNSAISKSSGNNGGTVP